MEEKDVNSRLSQLLLLDAWTEEEKKWLLDYISTHGDEELEILLKEQFNRNTDREEIRQTEVYSPEDVLSTIHECAGISQPQNKSSVIKIKRWSRVAAACVVLVLGAGYLLYQKQKNSMPEVVSKIERTTPQNDVFPGTEKATLMLDDGSAIVLDQLSDGKLASQGDAEIIKSGNGLDYQIGDNTNQEVVYNTIVTPRGGRFFVELSDGTKVWLNAASSIRFPVSFSGKERIVEVTGEVYFEVNPVRNSKIKNKIPFIVKINSPSGSAGEIKVLGTHFNVMAYTDEPEVKTTLLEGVVEYTNLGQSKKLLPGQQSKYSPKEGIRVFNDINLSEVIAWKNGFFHFEGSDLEVIMRRIGRWYNTDVVFKGKTPEKFYADIPMNTMLSDVLKALELTGKVNFKIENDTIIVNP